MGGKVFTTADVDRPALSTPRLPPAVFCRLMEEASQRLKQLFGLVACPVEAPGKTDYGDLDFVVAQPQISAFSTIWKQTQPADQCVEPFQDSRSERAVIIQRCLSATYHVMNPNGCTVHFAIPHPEEEGCFVQIDVTEQPVDLHAWTVFQDSYGDMWNIIGVYIRPFGLIVTDTGMYAMDPDIQKLDKKRSRTFLTRDPSNVLKFLALDPNKWESGWKTEHEMFDYAASSRMFSPLPFLTITKLKASDRKRLTKRPCFSRFLEIYVPSVLSAAGVSKDDILSYGVTNASKWPNADILREEILAEALNEFNAGSIYEENHQKWMDERLALDRKRQAKAERRIEHEKVNKGYAQHWIDWFLESLSKEQRQALDLDMDKGDGSAKDGI